MNSINKIVTIDANKARAEFFKILDNVYQGKNRSRSFGGKSRVDVFSRIWAFSRHKNQTDTDFDLLIAVTCLSHDLILVTYNHEHFKRVPRLKLLPAE